LSITDLKPYSYHMMKCGGLFSIGTYHVCYENKMVREVSGVEGLQLDAIIFLLNAAYQLGYSDGSVSR
jgi:hypothetical protein